MGIDSSVPRVQECSRCSTESLADLCGSLRSCEADREQAPVGVLALGWNAVGVARVGTSGWSYDHWGGVLYPPGTPPAKRLVIYTHEFDTVELNASHYR